MSETTKPASYLTRALDRAPVSPSRERVPPPESATGDSDERSYSACNSAQKGTFSAVRFVLKNGAFFTLDYSTRLQINGTLNGSHDAFTLIFSTAKIVVRGRQLERVLYRLEQKQTDLVREFDETRYDYPPKNEPMISSLGVSLPEARGKSERE